MVNCSIKSSNFSNNNTVNFVPFIRDAVVVISVNVSVGVSFAEVTDISEVPVSSRREVP